MAFLGGSFWEGDCGTRVTGVTMLCLGGGEEECYLALEEMFWSCTFLY